MTTVYIDAEKLISWNADGRMVIHEDVIEDLATHRQGSRFIVYFAPMRFGLYLDDDEVNEAWTYLEEALDGVGFEPDGVIFLSQNVSTEPFLADLKENAVQDRVFLLSDCDEDEALSRKLGIRKVSEIPSHPSNFWQKLNLSRALRSIVAAALHT